MIFLDKKIKVTEYFRNLNLRFSVATEIRVQNNNIIGIAIFAPNFPKSDFLKIKKDCIEYLGNQAPYNENYINKITTLRIKFANGNSIVFTHKIKCYTIKNQDGTKKRLRIPVLVVYA